MAKALHTDEVKARAITLAIEHGPAEAQRILAAEGHDVKPATVRSWCSRSGAVTVAAERTAAATEANRLRWDERRTALAHEIGEVAQMALDQTRTALADQDTRVAKDAALTLAILVDKAQLLTGAATSRAEHAAPETIHAVADEVAARRTKHAA